MSDSTVVYYTGHREKPDFEAKIQKTLLSTIGTMPLISVSQKPISGFGANIYVGDVGTSVRNAWRQLQIGVEQAQTRFIHVAESDYIYSPEYFSFRPPKDDTFYCPEPIYVLMCRKDTRHGFSLKRNPPEGAFVASRDFFLKRLDVLFADRPQWCPRSFETDEERHLPRRLRKHPVPPIHLISKRESACIERFPTQIPTMFFKTDDNLHLETRRSKDIQQRIHGYPRAAKMIAQYLGTGVP